MSYKQMGIEPEEPAHSPSSDRAYTPTPSALTPKTVSARASEIVQADAAGFRDARESLDEHASGSQARIILQEGACNGPARSPVGRPGRKTAHSPRQRPGSGAAWTALDFAAALLCSGLAINLIAPNRLLVAGSGWHGISTAFACGMLLALSVAVLSRLFDLHDLHRNRTWLREQSLILLTVGFAAFAASGAITLRMPAGLHLSIIAVEIGLTSAIMSLGRTVWRLQTTVHFKRGMSTRNFIIAGTGPVGREVREYLISLRYHGYNFKGFVTMGESVEGAKIPAVEVLGTIADIIPLSKLVFADEIIYSRRPETNVLMSTLVQARTTGINVRLIPSVSETLQNRSDVQFVGDLPTIVLHQRPTRAVSLLVKRLLDVGIAGAGLLATLPLSIAIAIAIKVDSSGPIFYSSDRIGFKGRVFPCYKFRTMTKHAETLRADLEHLNERGGILFKIAKDPRITRIGNVLRRYSLDEVPQLWNVLRGDMSLVGPRPPLSSEVAQYEIQHLRRLEVTPGITGLWQTESRQEPSVANYFELDHKYVSNWSIWLDLKILLRTVNVVLMGTGS